MLIREDPDNADALSQDASWLEESIVEARDAWRRQKRTLKYAIQ